MSRYAPKHCANRGGVGSAKGFAAVLLEWTLRCPLYLASAALLIAAALLVALLPIPLEGAYELNPATYADGDFLDTLANDYGDEVLQYAGAISQAHTGAEAYSALAQLLSYEASLGREGAGQLAWFASSLASLSVPETFASTHEAPALFLSVWALGGGVSYVVWFLPCVTSIASIALMTSRGMVLGRVPVSPRKTLVAMAACILVCGAAPVLVALGIAFAKGLLNGGLGDAAYPVMVGTAGQATLIEALTGSVCLLVAGLAALTMCGAALVRISRSAPPQPGHRRSGAGDTPRPGLLGPSRSVGDHPGTVCPVLPGLWSHLRVPGLHGTPGDSPNGLCIARHSLAARNMRSGGAGRPNRTGCPV